MVGLRERAKDKVQNYSLGMKQRLGIAGALLSDPKLLLLDEPANGLDPAGIVAMRETLRRLAASGKTVFVSSHLLAEVQVLADVVGIIARGRLVQEGPLDSLLTDQGVVRVRLPVAAAERARNALQALGTVELVDGPSVPSNDSVDLWLTIHVEPSRAAEVNRTLAEAGIYASGLESGTDLEMLFLELTGGEASSEGRMQGIDAPDAKGTPGPTS
jgi:ABC-2 type transport system ATP-binding protein